MLAGLVPEGRCENRLRLIIREALGPQLHALANLERDPGGRIAMQLPVGHGPSEEGLQRHKVTVLHRLGGNGPAGPWVERGEAMILEPNDVLG